MKFSWRNMKAATHKKVIGTRTTLSLAVLALLASSASSAADEGWYAGASLGRTKEAVNFDKVFRATLPAGVTLTSYSDGDDDTGFKLFGGYQFNDYLSVEGGYFELGNFDYRSTTTPAGAQYGNLDVDGWNLDLVGTLPLTPKLSALARFGFNFADTGSSFRGTGAASSPQRSIREDNNNYKYGLGLQYAFTEAFDMRLEAERYRVDEASGSKGDVDMLSLGVVYRFGREAPVAVAPTPAPAVAAAPQRSAPAPTPAPPPTPTRVSFSADSLFDFNSSVIKPAGKVELDKLAGDLRGVDVDTIQVTGHTDRIGAQAYNLRLSAERANAVKDYLVMSANITPAQVSTRGINGSDPVTTLAQCGNNLMRAQLIVCLAPDRRVEVEVSGTRPR
jgi:OOP family OmpA-OmpF porin